MFITVFCVAVTALAAGCVMGWLCGVHVTSAKQTQMRSHVRDLLRDVRTLKADAAKVQLSAEENALEQRQLRAAADLARKEAVKAANVIRTLRPTVRLIRTHNRELYS
jgi:hypothetical protein